MGPLFPTYVVLENTRRKLERSNFWSYWAGHADVAGFMLATSQKSTVRSPFAVGMVQAISLVAMAAEQAQQSQPAQPAQPADPAAESLGSNGGTVAVSEAQVAASRFEQAVVAQGVSIAPGILRLRPEDVLAHISSIGGTIAS